MNAAIPAMVLSLLCGEALAQTAGSGCNVTENIRSEMLGKTLTPALGDSIVEASGAKSYRIFRPGQASTGDVRTSRIVIHVDQDDKILSVDCEKGGSG